MKPEQKYLNRRGRPKITCVAAIILLISGCSQEHITQPDRAVSLYAVPTCDPNGVETCPASVVRVGKYGEACKLIAARKAGPPSYKVVDVGKTGMPDVTPAQAALLRRIRRFLPVPDLRFAFVHPVLGFGRFIVFEAKYGPCPQPFVTNMVLNTGGTRRNTSYSPWTGRLGATPGDVAPTPGPWCQPHQGVEPCYLMTPIPNVTRVMQCDESGRSPCTQGVAVGRFGIACRLYEAPGHTGSPSYNVADIGKPGVVELSSRQAKLVQRIYRYVESGTLRFAVGPFGPSDHRALIVFDAVRSPCYLAVPGYRVLNDADGNIYYQPGDANFVYPGDLDVPATPGPWCSAEPGVAPCD